MNHPVKQLLKIIILLMLALVLGCAMFAVGFGSAYGMIKYVDSPVSSASATMNPPTPLPAAGPSPNPSMGTPSAPREDEASVFGIFWESWALVQEYFYGDLPSFEDVTYAAIRGMLSTLDDDYTALMEPQVAVVVEEDATGEFEGIGAYVDVDDRGRFVITQPFRSGPAEEAGLVAGDAVLAVDGTYTEGMSLYDVIGLIRGPAGTPVTLLVQRPDIAEPFEVVVTRRRIEIPIVEAELREDGIAYLRLNEFSATASRLMRERLAELLAEDPVGLVLDLRQNPGGWLDQSIEVADLFLDEGVAARERSGDGTVQVFETRTGDIGERIPMVVLVDRGSASAAESVAGALQDRGRAPLIGETTYGKGSVQRPFTLSDGSELRVTVARWFTPADRAIHGEGLHPDIEVLWPDDPDSASDPQLERAVQYLLEGE